MHICRLSHKCIHTHDVPLYILLNTNFVLWAQVRARLLRLGRIIIARNIFLGFQQKTPYVEFILYYDRPTPAPTTKFSTPAGSHKNKPSGEHKMFLYVKQARTQIMYSLLKVQYAAPHIYNAYM